MSYMTQDKEEREFPYWTIIAENAGGLSLSFAPLAALPMPPHPAPACKDPTLVRVGSCAQARVRTLHCGARPASCSLCTPDVAVVIPLKLVFGPCR